jgi:hypothetical protein
MSNADRDCVDGRLRQGWDRLRRQHDLERVGLRSRRERVVRELGLGEREPMCREQAGVEPSLSFNSCGVVVVSTSPVVIVTSRIQSVSRCQCRGRNDPPCRSGTARTR